MQNTDNGNGTGEQFADKLQIRDRILELTKEYYEAEVREKKEYAPGDRITYAARHYDSKEMVSLVDSALEFWLTSGRFSDQFECEFAEFLGVRHALLVNSGSSANLLAFMSLTSPLLKERRINRGDEVITVAAGFPTTITPILQYGAIPVFVDITLPTCNIDISMLENAVTDKTKAVMIAHTLGNPFDLNKVKEFCDRHNLWLIEDNCDALGSKYRYNGNWQYTGTVGDIGTSSFYPPHHMTMGEGGAVYTSNPLLKKIMMSMRDWGRDCVCPSGTDNCCGARFDRQYGKLPVGYDHKYVYSHFGYNLKATDLQAAIGCEQLKKLPGFIERRKANYKTIYNSLKKHEDKLILFEASENSDPSWFGFLIAIKPDSGLTRDGLIKRLEKNNIQTRMLFSGNLIKHPCFDEMQEGRDYKVVGKLINTDFVMTNAFWIGVYPGMTAKMLEQMCSVISGYIGEQQENS